MLRFPSVQHVLSCSWRDRELTRSLSIPVFPLVYTSYCMKYAPGALMAAMESESQSIDISHLKKTVLAFHDSDEDGNRLTSSRQCLSPSVTGIAQPSLFSAAAAARPHLNASSTEPKTRTGRAYVNALGIRAHRDNVHVKSRYVQSSPGLVDHFRRNGADHEGIRSNAVERNNDEPLKSQNSETQLPSTVSESTERANARKRRPDMEILSSLSQGDTQPVSQWVYDEFTNKKKLKQAGSVNENMPGLIATTNGLPSYSSGHVDSGHIDLLGGFEQEVVGFPEEESDAANPEDDAMSDVTHLEADTDITPEWKGHQQPKTPATHGKKRDHRGEVISPTSTPRLPINPFANTGALGCGVLGLSQVFKATQAPTSPLIHGLPSDDMSERPSPELYFNQRLAVAGTSSSPVKIQRTDFQRAVTEPQAIYVSMKESQARRERALGLCRSSSMNGLLVEEDSDEDFGSEGSLLRRRRIQRKIEEEAKSQFAGLSAPSRPSTSGRDRRKGIAGRPTQASTQLKDNLPPDTFVISDDTPVANDLRSPSEDDTEHEPETGDDTPELMEPDENDKENVNHPGLQVPETTSRVKIHHVSENGSSQSPSLPRAGTSLGKERRLGGVRRRKPVPDPTTTGSSYSAERMDTLERGSQTVAVADSQASQSERKTSKRQRSASPKTPLLASSLCIPQSQIGLPFSYPLSEPSLGGHLVENNSSPLLQPPPLSSSLSRGSLSERENDNAAVVLDLASDPVVEPAAEKSSPSGLRTGRYMQSRQAKTSAGNDGLTTGVLDLNAGLDITPDTTSVAAPNVNLSLSILGADRACTFQPAEAKAKIPRSTIPDTSPCGGSELTSSAKQTSGKIQGSSSAPSQIAPAPNLERQAPQSNNPSVFETAQTHLTSETTHEASSRQESEYARSLISPKVTRLRHFTEVASPTLPDAIGGDDDVDIPLITSQDIRYQAAINGSSPVRPSRKRRRGVGGLVLPVSNTDSTRSSPASLHPSQERKNGDDGAKGNVQPTVGVEEPTGRVGRYTSPDPFINPRVGASTSEMTLAASEAATISGSPRPGIRRPTVAAISSVRSQARKLTPLPSRKAAPPTNKETAHVVTQTAIEPGPDMEDRTIQKTSTIAGITNPNQVFAHFNGRNAAYYPATCIDVHEGTERRFKVRFDDGTVDTLGAYGVKRLELRKGDHIKVDLPNMRTKSYIVLGLKNLDYTPSTRTPSKAGLLADTQSAQYIMTDLQGYSTVQVYQKQRDSLPGMDPLPDTEIISVPLNSVYLTQTMWSRFKDRQYTQPPSFALQRSGLTTPSEHPSTPSTTSSKSPRNKLPRPARDDFLLDQPTSGLFAGMVFAITYGKNEEEKQRVTQHIRLNGGQIVQDGFHELFHIPTLEPVTPSKTRNNQITTALSLKPHAAQLGFACVIADSHSRRKKHVQALALALPCLAGRWIEDCIAKNRVLNWEPYLLPSGESAFLGGAVRSRILQPYPAVTARLTATIEKRPKILAGRSVLLVMRGGKAEESRKAYLFLTYALGARKVSRALDLGAAKRILTESEESGERWDLVYVDGKKERAEKVLFGESAARGGDGDEERRTKVVGNEFVVQSLISGQLLEDV